jgi:hypothetical protein
MKKVLKQNLDKVKLNNLDFWKVWIKTKWLIWEAMKNSIFSKWHAQILWISSAITLLDLLTNESENRENLTWSLIETFLWSYIPLSGVWILVLWGRTIKFGWWKILDVSKKYLWKPAKHIWENKGKYILWWILAWGAIKIYTTPSENENQQN